MYLRGQDGQRGYAMAALLVALGVMAVLMAAAMPVWRHESQREREIETIFRGQQIARAIAMYREKNAGNFPSSLDLLVQQRFLRKKYREPFSEDGEWQPIGGLGNQPQPVGRGGQPQPAGRGGQPQPVGREGQPQPGLSQPSQVAGIMGVTLKDKGTAIIEYKRATHHNEWQFLFSDTRSRVGGSQGGRSGGGGPGGVGPGQPGRGNRPGGPGIGGPGMGGPGGRGPGGRGPGTGPGRGGGQGVPVPFPGRRSGGN